MRTYKITYKSVYGMIQERVIEAPNKTIVRKIFKGEHHPESYIIKISEEEQK